MADDIVVNMNFNLGKDQTVDDIVTRLREEVAKAEVAGVLPNWELAKCMWEAADEIERLRAMCDMLAIRLRSGSDSGWDDAIDAWEKVRRG